MSPAIKPDVSITNTEDHKTVFIEVLSETLVKMIRDANHFQFVGTVTPMCKGQLMDYLLKTIMKQRDCVVIPKSKEKIYLSDSLSSHDVVTYLQYDAFEAAAFVSCLSIVFYMLSEKVFKMSLDVIAHNTLATFTFEIHEAIPQPAQVLQLERIKQGYLYSLVYNSP